MGMGTRIQGQTLAADSTPDCRAIYGMCGLWFSAQECHVVAGAQDQRGRKPELAVGRGLQLACEPMSDYGPE